MNVNGSNAILLFRIQPSTWKNLTWKKRTESFSTRNEWSLCHLKSLIREFTEYPVHLYRFCKSVLLFCVSVLGRLRDLQHTFAVTSGSPSTKFSWIMWFGVSFEFSSLRICKPLFSCKWARWNLCVINLSSQHHLAVPPWNHACRVLDERLYLHCYDSIVWNEYWT